MAGGTLKRLVCTSTQGTHGSASKEDGDRAAVWPTGLSFNLLPQDAFLDSTRLQECTWPGTGACVHHSLGLQQVQAGLGQ